LTAVVTNVSQDDPSGRIKRGPAEHSFTKEASWRCPAKQVHARWSGRMALAPLPSIARGFVSTVNGAPSGADARLPASSPSPPLYTSSDLLSSDRFRSEAANQAEASRRFRGSHPARQLGPDIPSPSAIVLRQLRCSLLSTRCGRTSSPVRLSLHNSAWPFVPYEQGTKTGGSVL
jgi:hypothetical protein